MLKYNSLSKESRRILLTATLFLLVFLLAGIAEIYILMSKEAILQSFDLRLLNIEHTVLRPVLSFTLSFLGLSLIKWRMKGKTFLTLTSKNKKVACLLTAGLLTLVYVLLTVSALTGFGDFPLKIDITFFVWTYNPILFIGIGTAFYFGWS